MNVNFPMTCGDEISTEFWALRQTQQSLNTIENYAQKKREYFFLVQKSCMFIFEQNAQFVEDQSFNGN